MHLIKSIFQGAILLILIGFTMKVEAYMQSDPGKRPILVVTTDIGGDPDDQQSLTRLLVYSNEFDIRGLIASASGTPGELGVDTVKDQLIRDHIMAYARVYENLTKHAPGYPEPDTLMARVKRGNTGRGLDYVGEGHDTEGSEWIIKVVDGAGDRPVHVAIWGGQTDLVQALWKVKHDRNSDAYRQFLSMLRVYDINDQDGIYSYIRQEFSGIFYILAKAPEGADKRDGVYRGMYLGGEESFTSREWIDAHVRRGHGPLGELYPPETWTSPNPHGALKEGDTPSWFYFLQNGLQYSEQSGWGGWGGRFQPDGSYFFKDDEDFADMVVHPRSTLSRWRPTFQNDFQARMDWCVLPYEQANHNPVAVVMGDATRDILWVEANQGDTLTFSALDSYDMDGDKLDFTWWTYPEAGTNLQCPILNHYVTPEVSFIVPYGEGGHDLHLICEVSDRGSPSLTSYRRIVIQIF